jgi:hypothetical protein
MGVELAAPGERVFMCTENEYIFEKRKKHMKKTTTLITLTDFSVSKEKILGKPMK